MISRSKEGSRDGGVDLPDWSRVLTRKREGIGRDGVTDGEPQNVCEKCSDL